MPHWSRVWRLRELAASAMEHAENATDPNERATYFHVAAERAKTLRADQRRKRKPRRPCTAGSGRTRNSCNEPLSESEGLQKRECTPRRSFSARRRLALSGKHAPPYREDRGAPSWVSSGR